MAASLLSLLLFLVLTSALDLSPPPGVDIWCGKAYRPENAPFPPGGELRPPPDSAQPVLSLLVYSRMSTYSSDEEHASMIVDLAVSRTCASNCFPLGNVTDAQDSKKASTPSIISLDVLIGGQTVRSNVLLRLNSTGNEITFPLAGLTAQSTPYDITAHVSHSKNQTSSSALSEANASSNLSVVPTPTTGSFARVDRLTGNVQVRAQDSNTFTPLFPYSYYVSWGGWLQQDVEANVRKFKDYGFNMIHPIPGGNQDSPWEDWSAFEQFMDVCDEIGLWVMYDLRWTYKNTTSLSSQIDRFKDRKSLVLWYTADEPDGHGDPLSAPADAAKTIRELDPHHPISVALNCENFYFEQYTTGADIVLEDAYPVAINASYSTVYHTPCNATYGDCGCDNCVGTLTDVSARFETFKQYERWTGAEPKSLWAVPQVFGNESFWSRYPTAEEEVAMVMLGVNHGARGVVGWLFPTSDELLNVSSALATVVTGEDVEGLLLSGKPHSINFEENLEADVAEWESEGRMLISVVVVEGAGDGGNISLEIPGKGEVSIDRVLWGNNTWSVEGRNIVGTGMKPLSVSLLIVMVGDAEESKDDAVLQNGFIEAGDLPEPPDLKVLAPREL